MLGDALPMGGLDRHRLLDSHGQLIQLQLQLREQVPLTGLLVLENSETGVEVRLRLAQSD